MLHVFLLWNISNCVDNIYIVSIFLDKHLLD